MNRFCKSTFSLLLATLLLFSAAGISFGMVLQSTHAYAVGPSVETPAPAPDEEDQQETSGQDEQEKPQETEQPEEQPPASTWSPQDQKINIMGEEKTSEKKETTPESEQNTQEGRSDPPPENTHSFPSPLQGKILNVTFDGEPIQSAPIREKFADLILTIFIEGVDKSALESYKNDEKIDFESKDRFIPNNSSGSLSMSIYNITSKDDGVEFTAKISNVIFSGTSSEKSIIFSFVFKHEDGTSSTFSEEVELKNIPSDTTDDSISIYLSLIHI